jgi:hypothetical protein
MQDAFWEDSSEFGKIPVEKPEAPNNLGAEDLAWIIQDHKEDLRAVDRVTELRVKKDLKDIPNWEWNIYKKGLLPDKNSPERQAIEDTISSADLLVSKGVVSDKTIHAARTLVALKQTEFEEVINNGNLLLKELPLSGEDSDLNDLKEDTEAQIEECRQALIRTKSASYYLSTLMLKSTQN